MSKVSSVEYPSYTGGSVSIGGANATANLVDGVLTSNYNMSEAEKAIYGYAQNSLANILPQLNVFSSDTMDSIQSQLNAYQSQGTDTINDIYAPMIKNLQNDVASRFGNFDNSVFMDNLNGIESKRGDAVTALAEDVLAKRNELVASELNNRYTYAAFLSDLQNQAYSNALNTINTALGSSSSANSYNNNLYNALYKQYLSSNASTNASSLSSILANSLGLS